MRAVHSALVGKRDWHWRLVDAGAGGNASKLYCSLRQSLWNKRLKILKLTSRNIELKCSAPHREMLAYQTMMSTNPLIFVRTNQSLLRLGYSWIRFCVDPFLFPGCSPDDKSCQLAMPCSFLPNFASPIQISCFWMNELCSLKPFTLDTFLFTSRHTTCCQCNSLKDKQFNPYLSGTSKPVCPRRAIPDPDSLSATAGGQFYELE
jgi:hypothetical protein